MNTRFLFAAILFLCLPWALYAQTLDVSPARILVDESATIRASGLQPSERITLRAELTDGAGNRWTSQADFLADAQGAVNTAAQAPIKGSYDEVSAMGLVWSMKPEESHVVTYQSPHDEGVQIIEFHLLQNGRQAATAKLEQLTMAEGVRQIKVEGKLHGILFLPPGDAPHPGVLVVGGSEGGVPHAKAAWLASRGFAALALAYFRFEDLPPDLEAIPLEYFGSAIGWMMQRPEILPGQIAVVGVSRGGELALQLASMYPELKAVVAYVPANVRYPSCCGGTRVPYAWTWKGEALSFVPMRDLRNPMAAILSHAAIAVEQTRGPILLISGEDDGVWPSSMMADAVAARLKSAHFSFTVENYKYPHAGHHAGRPEIIPTWHGHVVQPVSGRGMDLGGNPKGDANSTLDAIPKVLAFLHESLAPTAAPQVSPKR